ncbi:DUF5103 domain-containing protein [Bacteroidota bacterium]
MQIPVINTLKSPLIFLVVIYLAGCVPVTNTGSNTSQSEELVTFEDKIYEPDIKTVRLYVNKGYKGAINEPAVNNIRQLQQFVLEFDELSEQAEYYQARILHCDRNWNKSLLQSIEYLDTYNEYDITDYDFSANTRIPYTHYTFLVPRVNIPGNYLLVIYKRDNPGDLVLTRRFMTFDTQVEIRPSFTLSSGINERRTHQQVDFKLDYSGLDILNPHEEVSIVIRQNKRWDNTISNLKASFIREIQKELDYSYFNLENNFHGGNEFRFFDLRSIRAPGQNVGKVDISNDRVDAYIMVDKDRSYQYYGHREDLNGGYYIENFDTGDDILESQYVNVHFFLESEEEYATDVYVFGELSNWSINPDNRLTFDPELKGYRGDLLLKQGWYDYIFHTPQNPYLVEGSHFETENVYEIFVYYRFTGGKADLLVGYKIINFGGR